MSEPPSDVTPNREVRVSVYAERVLRRWYVVVAAVVVAIGVGFVHGRGSGARSDATATVYMGQPVTPTGSSLFPSSPWTSATAVTKVVAGDAALAAAASAAHVPVSSLRGRVTTHLLSSSATTTTGAKSTSGATFYSVEAEGPWTAARAGIIANVLAGRLRDAANGYADSKASTLKTQIAAQRATIATLAAANKVAQKEIKRFGHAASVQDLALISTLVSQVSSNTNTMANTQAQLTTNLLQYASVVDLEAASVTAPARGHTVSATTRHSSLVVAAVLGLIIGVALALLWDAVATRPQVAATG